MLRDRLENDVFQIFSDIPAIHQDEHFYGLYKFHYIKVAV
jgi:hypothetical protein